MNIIKVLLVLSCISTTQIKPADSQALSGPGRTLLPTRANQVDRETQTDEDGLNTSFECDICLMPIVANGEDDEKPKATPCQHLFHKGCLDRAQKAQLEARTSASCPTCRGLLNILPGQDPHNARRKREAREAALIERSAERIKQMEKNLALTLKGTVLIAGVLLLTRATPTTYKRFEFIGLLGSVGTYLVSDIQPAQFDNVSKTIVMPAFLAMIFGSMLAHKINAQL